MPEQFRALIFTALINAGVDIKPYCVGGQYFHDALYLPNAKTVIFYDSNDSDNSRRNNPVYYTTRAISDGFDVLRIRDFEHCEIINSESLDYYMSEYSEANIRKLLAYIITEYTNASICPDLPSETECKGCYEQAVRDYDGFFTQLCEDFMTDEKHTLRLKDVYKGYAIGAWLAFHGPVTLSTGKIIQSRSDALASTNAMAQHAAAADANKKINDATWDLHYNQLVAYHDEHGNTDTGRHYVLPDGYDLGSWAERQRNDFKQGKISDYRKEKLNALGFNWSPENSIAEKWNAMYALLCEYRTENHNCNVAQRCVYHDQPLGKWVSKQRTMYRTNSLLQERIDKLNEIGFVWVLRHS